MRCQDRGEEPKSRRTAIVPCNEASFPSGGRNTNKCFALVNTTRHWQEGGTREYGDKGHKHLMWLGQNAGYERTGV